MEVFWFACVFSLNGSYTVAFIPATDSHVHALLNPHVFLTYFYMLFSPKQPLKEARGE